MSDSPGESMSVGGGAGGAEVAGGDGAARPWGDVAAKLLPALLHDVNNATQLLVGLKAMLEIPGGEKMFASRVDDLGRTSSRMDDLGFALAVLSTSGGANMLMARREARSIEILWDLTLKAFQRNGGEVIQVEGVPPRTAPGALDGWQPAWSVAALVAECSDRSGHLDWAWSWAEDGSLVGVSASGIDMGGDKNSDASGDTKRGALRSIAERAPGLVLEASPGRVQWRAPDEWLIRTPND